MSRPARRAGPLLRQHCGLRGTDLRRFRRPAQHRGAGSVPYRPARRRRLRPVGRGEHRRPRQANGRTRAGLAEYERQAVRRRSRARPRGGRADRLAHPAATIRRRQKTASTPSPRKAMPSLTGRSVPVAVHQPRNARSGPARPSIIPPGRASIASLVVSICRTSPDAQHERYICNCEIARGFLVRIGRVEPGAVRGRLRSGKADRRSTVARASE